MMSYPTASFPLSASILTRCLAAILPLALVLACSDSTGPEPELTMASVAGVYVANASNGEITTSEDGTTIDQLAAGASVRLDLHADGTTEGQVFIPEAGEEGDDFQADLAGEWSLTGSSVQLDHGADTFLRDMTFQVRGDQLEGSAQSGSLGVNVVLVRSSGSND